MKDPNRELFFVQVREPNEVRKHILQTLKDILEVLHRFEKFRQIRHEKSLKVQKLRVLLKDANKMLGSLKLKLPQTDLKALSVKETAKEPRKAAEKKKARTVQEKEKHPVKEPLKDITELEKLEAQLNAVEAKLKELT